MLVENVPQRPPGCTDPEFYLDESGILRWGLFVGHLLSEVPTWYLNRLLAAPWAWEFREWVLDELLTRWEG